MKKLLLVLWLVGLPVALAAQQGRTGVEGFEFASPLQIAIGSDNNFLVDRSNPGEAVPELPPGTSSRPQMLDDKMFMVTLPKIAYRNDSRRHELIVTWMPEFEVFMGNGDQNSMNHQALASFNYYIRRNFQVTFGDTFRSTKDPARTLDNVFLLLPRSRYRENDFQASMDFQPDRKTNFEIRYDASWAKFGQSDPFRAQILDARTSGYSVSLTRMLRKTHRIRGRYSLFITKPINQPAPREGEEDIPRASEFAINSASLEYRAGLNPTTVIDVSAGIIRLDTGINYGLRAGLYKRIGYYSFGGGYQRTLAFQAQTQSAFAQGLDANGFYDVLIFRFRGQPTKNTAIKLDTSMSRDVASPLLQRSKSLMSNLRLDYRLDERKVLFASWETFQQTRNIYLRAPLARNRYMIGIEISLSSDSQRRVSRVNQDADYVALTDRARRRRALEGN